MKIIIFLDILSFRMAREDSDEDDEQPGHMYSKWSSPVMQKQRMAYMDNLNARKRVSKESRADHFSET
jgi:hypothetical protein